MASLIITSGQREGDFYPLGRRTNVVGRDEALPIQILDGMVSRKHMQIRYDVKTQTYYAFDMKSRNGVFVNNQPIRGETPLADGDVILVGMTALMFVEKDFTDKESALRHYKKVGERLRVTAYGPNEVDLARASRYEPAQSETGHPINP